MMNKSIQPIQRFDQTLTAPPDKSMTHRAVMFSAFSTSQIKVYHALAGEDCLATMDCMRRMGATVTLSGDTVTVKGTSRPQSCDLYVGNSGTTMRLLSGLLCAQQGKRFTLDGDASIRTRPMSRVIEPLRRMGADIFGQDAKAPLTIAGKRLTGIDYASPIASAQVKSAVLLAGLYADGKTTVTEPFKSRDHTERLLAYFGAQITSDAQGASVTPSHLVPRDVSVVGDISSAAYPLVLAAAKKGGHVVVKRVGTNPTRDGILRVLTACGAQFRLTNAYTENEPYADIELEYAPLKPFVIQKELVPLLVDEIPALAVLACFIEGESVIMGAEELKVKESNRIDTVVGSLKALGANIEARPDGMVVYGNGSLKGGAEIDAKGDHRIAMSMAVAAALSREGGVIKGAECAAVSYPNFWEMFA